ncbi:MAG: hypothetical protein JSW46_13540 [Gemmatimonadota bacterium]|nr:MAG: hypothetical protein JSW46_13540 [Gemmatimonadota bacterium]
MYVPTPRHVPHPSPQVRELGHKIESVVREYQQTHRLSPHEVQQALRMAEANTGASRRSAGMFVGIGAALTGALVLGGILFWRQAEQAPDGSGLPMIPIIAMAVVGLAVVALAVRFRS